jgi:hypothetical protein
VGGAIRDGVLLASPAAGSAAAAPYVPVFALEAGLLLLALALAFPMRGRIIQDSEPGVRPDPSPASGPPVALNVPDA